MGTKGERTRSEIIEAAKGLFYRRGFGQTSFSDIVEQTGIRRGNINHYFRTKRDILEAVVEQRASEYRAILRDWDTRQRTPKQRLHRFVQMVVAYRHELTRYGCPIGTLCGELGKESSYSQDAARILFDVFRDWLTTQFEQLGEPTQARARALHLLGRAEGISVMAHVYGDPALVATEVSALEKWINGL